MSWLGGTLVATGLLMAAVIVLRAPVRRVFGAGAAYALWALPALRLVLPSLPTPLPAAVAPLDAMPTVAVQVGTAAGEGASWLLALWAGGALGFLLWQLLAYCLFAVRALAGATPVGMQEGVELLVSAGVDGPVALGFLRRRILLPADWDARYSPEERLLALRHEATHHARLDLWANAAALGLLALHWFNPLAHWAYRLFRQDQELACDAAVVGGADADTRGLYARALIKTAAPASGAPNLSATLIHGPDLKRRVIMLHTHKTRRSPLGVLAVSALTLAGLGLTATGGIAQTAAGEPTVTIKRVERHTGKPMTEAERNAFIDKEISTHCPSDLPRALTQAETVQNGKKVITRTVSCSKDGLGQLRPDQLQSARESLSKLQSLSPEDRARIATALDSAIVKARAGQ